MIRIEKAGGNQLVLELKGSTGQLASELSLLMAKGVRLIADELGLSKDVRYEAALYALVMQCCDTLKKDDGIEIDKEGLGSSLCSSNGKKIEKLVEVLAKEFQD